MRCVQGYQKCDMRHVHRVTRNMTWELCRVIRNVTRHVYKVIRNVTDICTGLSEMWHEAFYQNYDMRCVLGCEKCVMRHVHRVIRNVTWDMFTRLSEMWHETCVQGYQKCYMSQVCKVIRNVADMFTNLSEMWQTYAQCYPKCDMRLVYRISSNVTWGMCTGLPEIGHEICAGLWEMWQETCAQGYQKCDIWQVYKIIRNVADMYTRLS